MNLKKKLLVVALASAFAQSAQAATFTWDCARNDDWQIQTCWGPDGLPTSADIVQINTPWQVRIVPFTGTAFASQLLIGGGGSVLQSAGGLLVAVERIGESGVGTYTQSGGTNIVSSALFVGNAVGSGSDGTYTQTGGTLNANRVVIGDGISKGVASVISSTWNVATTVTVGSTNTSGFGGQLSVGSSGTVTIDGTLSVNRPSGSNTKVGKVSTSGGGVIKVGGAMVLNGGTAESHTGTVDSAGVLFESDMITANSALVISAGSLWSTNTLIAGRTGTGTLNIGAGGKVTASDAYIGQFAGSTGNIIVGGSNTLLQVADLYVGGGRSAGGTGTLSFDRGGTAEAGSLTVWNAGNVTSADGGVIKVVGAMALSGGKATNYWGAVDSAGFIFASDMITANGATVGGAGSLWSTNTLIAGRTGTGTLNITADGKVTASTGYVAEFAGSTGNILIGGNGALLQVAGGLFVGGGISGSGGTGTLSVDTGGTVTAGSLTVRNGNSSIKTGTTDSFTGGIIDIAGELTLQGGGKATSVFGFVDNRYSNIDSGIYAHSATIGAGSRWDTAYHLTGFTGTGTLTVNGGVVKSTGDTYVGGILSSDGTMNINAGGFVDTDGSGFLGLGDDAIGKATVGGTDALWDVAGGLYVGGDTTVNGGATGTLAVNTGGTVTAGSLTVWNGKSSIKTGTTASSTGGIIDIAGELKLRGGGIATGNNGFVDVSYAGPDSGIYAGSASIGGAGSRWDTAFHYTGFTGTGELNLTSGGTLKSTEGTYVGTNSGSSGTLNINAGGMVDTGGNGYLGFRANATGAATVGGAGALWNVAGGLYVGGTAAESGGTGTLTVNTGGTVQAGSLKVWNLGRVTTAGGGVIQVGGAMALSGGRATSSWGVVDSAGAIVGSNMITANGAAVGAGSVWVTDTLIAGRTGTGILNITANGWVSAIRNVFIAEFADSTGNIIIGGSNALLQIAGSLFVGGNAASRGGTGTLTVMTGGTVSSVSASGAYKVWETGVVNMNGGTLTARSLDNFGAFNFNAGRVSVFYDLSLNGFGTLGSLALGKFGTLSVDGATKLNDFSTLDVNGGTFSTGSLVDNGGFAFNSGTFKLTNSNLVIGAGGLFGGNVAFNASRTVHVTNNVTVMSGAILALDNAVFSAGSYTNHGTVDLAGSVSTAGGGQFTNNSLLTGNGTLTARLSNAAGAEVRVTAGDTLSFKGAGNTNDGKLNLLGGSAVFTQGLTNNASGLVTGHGALIANAGLTNNGTLATTAVTDIQGNVANDATGRIVVAGTTTTFYDDVVHNGAEFKVNNGAQAVFFGSYSGAGNFTGTGELVFAGDLMPGNSPALIDVQGDLTLQPSVATTMELGGRERGTQYDAFDVAGHLTLAGILNVTLYDSGGGVFAPREGDTFDIFAATTLEGSFSTANYAALAPDLVWSIDYLTDAIGTTDLVRLSVSAVPEPETYVTMLMGLGLIGWQLRRKAAAAARRY